MKKITGFFSVKNHLFILVVLFYIGNVEAKIYKWKDENGKVHYTQTLPPSKKINKVKELDIKESRSSSNGQTGDVEYCQALRKYSVSVAVAMKGGKSSAAVKNNIQAADDKLKDELNTNDAILSQVLYYIYSFKKIDLSPNQIANLVYKQCRGGGYGSSLVKKGGKKRGSHQASSGTGWPIAQGYVVTNYHVVENGSDITLQTVSGDSIKAELFKADKKNDVAILKVHNPSKLPFALPLASEKSKLGAKVFTIGYPHPDLMGSKPKLTSGTVSSLYGLRDDPRTYQISVPVQAGNSGGPLINMSGEVVGIVTSKLSAVKIFDWTGDLPQNVNYALKIKHLDNLLNQVENKKHQVNEHASKKNGTLADLATKLQNSILLIISRKK